MLVTGLTIYPVKGAAGVPLATAAVEPWGLAGDRRWAVVDGGGAKVTSTRARGLLHVRAALRQGRPGDPPGLALEAPGHEALAVDAPVGGPQVPVGLSRLDTAVDAGPAAATWLSEVLGSAVRLVWLDDPTRRPVAVDHGGRPGEPLSLADAGPLLLTTEASLRQVDAWAAEEAARRGEPAPAALAMARFRPNLVVDGDQPFDEDRWHRFRVGDVTFRVGEACDRCVVTTYDPDTLDAGREPMRSLRRHRHRARHVWFGLRVVPEATGTLTLGDPLEVLPA